jgi:hypothetical protein
MKRTRIKRKSTTPVAKLKAKLWELCKQIIRKRDGNVCIICGKGELEGANWHGGHFIPSAACGAFLRYDLRNIHSSCYHCNINLGGNGALFYKRLVDIYGQDFVDGVFRDKQIVIKADVTFYSKKIAEYEELVNLSQKKLQAYTKSL